MLLSVKDIPEASLDPNVEQNFDAESGQCFFFLEAKQATPYRELHIALLAEGTYDVCVLSIVIKGSDVIATVVSKQQQAKLSIRTTCRLQRGTPHHHRRRPRRRLSAGDFETIRLAFSPSAGSKQYKR